YSIKHTLNFHPVNVFSKSGSKLKIPIRNRVSTTKINSYGKINLCKIKGRPYCKKCYVDCNGNCSFQTPRLEKKSTAGRGTSCRFQNACSDSFRVRGCAAGRTAHKGRLAQQKRKPCHCCKATG